MDGNPKLPDGSQRDKQSECQIQTLPGDPRHVFQIVSFEDVTPKQSFMRLVHEYVQHLEFIVERLLQYGNHASEFEVNVFEHVVQNLRQYILVLKQFYNGEYSSVEMNAHFHMYVEKIAHEFEQLIAGLEDANSSFYNFVHDILVKFLSATHFLYKYVLNIHEYPQYVYSGPYSPQYYGDNYCGGLYSPGKSGQYYGQHYGLDKYPHGVTGLGHYGQGYRYGCQNYYRYHPYGFYWFFAQ